MRDKEFAAYKKALGLGSVQLPTVETLELMVRRHVELIPYQNMDLVIEARKPVLARKSTELTVPVLIQKLLIEKRGGMCYETSELMYAALTHVGFDVKRLACAALNGEEYDATRSHNHNILVVTLQRKAYLVDVGYGYNSLHAPIGFDLDNALETVVDANDHYRMQVFEDHYVLSLKIQEAWCSLYSFERPLSFSDEMQTKKDELALLQQEGDVPIRDVFLKLGGPRSSSERVGFHVPLKEGAEKSKMTLYGKQGNHSQFFDSPEDLKQCVKDSLDLDISPDLFLSISSQWHVSQNDAEANVEQELDRVVLAAVIACYVLLLYLAGPPEQNNVFTMPGYA